MHAGGASAEDAWHGAQTGFRTDWQSGNDTVMVEGDFYRNNDEAENGRQYGGDIVGALGSPAGRRRERGSANLL